MNASVATSLAGQLEDRQRRLRATIAEVGEAGDLVRLLHEVDSALQRLNDGGLGGCEVCGESVDDEVLEAHPLIPYCLCKLTAEQQGALQRDLDLAWRVQAALLPRQDLSFAGWQAHHRYLPAGPVSGDYCDLIPQESDDSLHVLFGDVSGKGVAASLQMARLDGLLRSLIAQGRGVRELVEEANRHLSERDILSHFATVICARADSAGRIELCNAGHCLPIVVRRDRTETVESSGLPIGIGEDDAYEPRTVTLAEGDLLVLYSDGVSEARNTSGGLFGVDSLRRVLEANRHLRPAGVANACLRAVAAFRGTAAPSDDLTIMVIRREGA